MAQSFHKLPVLEIVQQTPSAVQIVFDVPLELKPNFEYRNGQYITIKAQIGDEEVRRSYSICSAPQMGEKLAVAVKKVADGIMSNWLCDQVKPGDQLEISEPEGNFIQTGKPSKKVFLYAGGSGITPVISIIKKLLSDSSVSIYLAYANTDPSEIIFKEALDQLQEEHKKRLSITHFLEVDAHLISGAISGRIPLSHFSDLGGRTLRKSQHFICGPGPMMEFVKNTLLEKNVTEENIILEYFVAPESENTDVDTGNFSGDAQVKIILDGAEVTLPINEKEALLTGMLRQGLDAPYSCQGGVCASCRAKITDGEVFLSQNLGITDGEVKEGYTLTCSSYPRSANITVNFDEA